MLLFLLLSGTLVEIMLLRPLPADPLVARVTGQLLPPSSRLCITYRLQPHRDTQTLFF